MHRKPILITGATGFLGSLLTNSLLQKQFTVVVYSRSEKKAKKSFAQPLNVYTKLEQLPDAGEFSVIVNLAGAGILDRPWTKHRQQELRDSRICLTRGLVNWIQASQGKPELLISGSAIGYYGNQGDQILTERSEAVPDFAHQLCADWEAEALKVSDAGVRVCIIRTGMVLGNGGFLKLMLPMFRFGLGSVLGDGLNWNSWIHWKDWVAIVETMINNADLKGVYNATSPNPVSNRELTLAIAKAMPCRLWLPPVPVWLLRKTMGEMADLLLASARVNPERILQQGFQFQYPGIDMALMDVLHPDQISA